MDWLRELRRESLKDFLCDEVIEDNEERMEVVEFEEDIDSLWFTLSSSSWSRKPSRLASHSSISLAICNQSWSSLSFISFVLMRVSSKPEALCNNGAAQSALEVHKFSLYQYGIQMCDTVFEECIVFE
jgi:hypothetical protein